MVYNIIYMILADMGKGGCWVDPESPVPFQVRVKKSIFPVCGSSDSSPCWKSGKIETTPLFTIWWAINDGRIRKYRFRYNLIVFKFKGSVKHYIKVSGSFTDIQNFTAALILFLGEINKIASEKWIFSRSN